MLLADVNFCASTAKVWQLVGNVLLVFKIVIPILLIIWGMMDLGKAVVAAKDDEIKKATKSLAMRIIAGIIIFFIPTIIGFVFTLVTDFGSVQNDYDICASCISSPGKCDTSKSK